VDQNNKKKTIGVSDWGKKCLTLALHLPIQLGNLNVEEFHIFWQKIHHMANPP
jgi:hypothetical protein